MEAESISGVLLFSEHSPESFSPLSLIIRIIQFPILITAILVSSSESKRVCEVRHRDRIFKKYFLIGRLTVSIFQVNQRKVSVVGIRSFAPAPQTMLKVSARIVTALGGNQTTPRQTTEGHFQSRDNTSLEAKYLWFEKNQCDTWNMLRLSVKRDLISNYRLHSDTYVSLRRNLLL